MITSFRRGSLVVAAVVGLLGLAGCVTIPEGPTYAALPGSRSTFDQFQVDDAACRQFSTQAIGGMTPQQNANNAAAGSAVVGTALGAAIGGLLGGSDGAAVGAGMGLFTGAAVGAGNAQAAGFSSQQRYDNAYYQCMYSRGHRVPVPASMARSMRQASAGVPPPSAPAPYRAPSRVATPPPNAAFPPPNTPPPPGFANPAPGAPPPNAAIPPPNAPPPPDAAIPPRNAPPPPYQPR
jgi:uncharacterized protein YcfJ